MTTKKGGVVDNMSVKNINNLQASFRVDMLNMFIKGASQFDRFCTKFQVEKRMNSFCVYISLLCIKVSWVFWI